MTTHVVSVEATDEKCSHFRKLIHILDVLIDGFETISNSWRSAANAYSKAKNSMSVGMDTIQAVKSATNRTRAEVHKMVRGLAQGNGNAVPTRSDMMAIKVNLTQEEQETRALDKLLDGKVEISWYEVELTFLVGTCRCECMEEEGKRSHCQTEYGGFAKDSDHTRSFSQAEDWYGTDYICQ